MTKRPPGTQVLFFVIGVKVLTPFCRIRALKRPRLTCPAFMYIVETECAKIARTLVSAREHFNLASRQSAQQALETNLVSLNPFRHRHELHAWQVITGLATVLRSHKHWHSKLGTHPLQAKAKQAASLRQQQTGPASSFSPLSAARRSVPPVHLNNTMRGTSRTVLGEGMPLVEPNPSYKAWGYLVCNELAQGVGRQMYYTDEIGDSNRRQIFQGTPLILEHVQACCICSQHPQQML